MQAKVHIDPAHVVGTINPDIYGHFAEHLGRCIYEGIWVGEESAIPNRDGLRVDVLEALKQIRAPVVRWPGGCFADDYHWEDGIGPRESRPRTVNIHWGEVIETNEFGTHEFVRFCRKIGAEPYICGNVGSGTAAEMRRWVEYCNFAGDSSLARARTANGHPEPFAVKYWGVGNENWGCGGQFDPEDYATEFRRFSTFLRGFTLPIQRIACGPSGNDTQWTQRFFEKMKPKPWLMQNYAAHLYYSGVGNDVSFSDGEYYRMVANFLRMERLVVQQRAIMDGYDPDRKIGLIVDEWGVWHPQARGDTGLEQQNTLRDALVAAATLDVFNRHADKVVMANIAQTINVLQCVIFTMQEKMVLTPTYHVYDLYQPHMGAESLLLNIEAETIDVPAPGETVKLPTVTGSASLSDRRLFLTLVNTHIDSAAECAIEIGSGAEIAAARARVLTSEDVRDHNTFEQGSKIQPRETEIAASGSGLVYTAEPHSVSAITLELR